MPQHFFVKNVTTPVASPDELGTPITLPFDGSHDQARVAYAAVNPVVLGDVVRVVADVSVSKAVSGSIVYEPVV